MNYHTPKQLVQIIELFENHGYSARLVGGAVRDHILGKTPKDYDIATDCPPLTGQKIFIESGYKVIPTGLAYGTITVLTKKGPVEITTLRSDVSTDGRRAEVAFGASFEEDALRRDFTINALSQDKLGKIYDYFGGINDIKTKTLRFVGTPATRVQEDYLRILRFFRFKARLKFESDPSALLAIKAHVHGLKKVSQERITDELSKTFECQEIEQVIKEIFDVGLFQLLFPELILKDQEKICLLFTNTDNLQKEIKLEARLAGLVLLSDGLGEKNITTFVTNLGKRLKLSTYQHKLLAHCVLGLMRLEERFTDRAQGMEFIDHLEKHAKTPHLFSKQLYFVWQAMLLSLPSKNKSKNLAALHELEKEYGCLRKKEIPIDGNDLKKVLHIDKGPELGKILSYLKESFRNGEWCSKEEGIIYAENFYNKKSSERT